MDVRFQYSVISINRTSTWVNLPHIFGIPFQKNVSMGGWRVYAGMNSVLPVGKNTS